jgi:Domain of unknown function (DUF4123)
MNTMASIPGSLSQQQAASPIRSTQTSGEGVRGEEPEVIPRPALGELAIRALLAEQKPLFAILDAARDPLVLARLLDHPGERQSLYEGTKGDQLAAVAPYLAAFPAESSSLQALIDDGWGKSWGVFLTSDQPFQEVRKHLRRFLMVELAGQKPVYFRFYDPRVLRPFLPSCSPAELAQFFGPIQAFLMESEDPELILHFSFADATLRRADYRLDGDPRPYYGARLSLP